MTLGIAVRKRPEGRVQLNEWRALETGNPHLANSQPPNESSSMNITHDIGNDAAEQAISEGEALQSGMAEKSKEFVESGAEVYTTA